MPRPISRCRVCGNAHLVQILDLGDQALTGIFPSRRDEPIERGPLQLLKCEGAESCGLVQLGCSFDPNAMYGENYGYRSSLNASMAQHLHRKVERVRSIAPLRSGDLVVDIGSNDGTTLAAYPTATYDLVGIDPAGDKFRKYYVPQVELIADFFSRDILRKKLGPRRARVVTSFAMFYDLEEPLSFMSEVLDLLEHDGIWVFEQSYLPAMIQTNGFDTVCHEHTEYYSLSTIKWMADKAGGKIIDVEFNDVNGGSFSVTMTRSEAPQPEMQGLTELLASEHRAGYEGLEPFKAFADRIATSRDEILKFFHRAQTDGALVCGLGASTKGNVLLQYCGLTEKNIGFIGEVNADKFGCFTPGSLIPILPETELFARKPDYTFVLPWHFRPFFERNAKFNELKLVFPLPKLSVG
ncbi:methyltransferase domain-containing protein [Bradyrhizobium sp. 200]|uniref:class I SAM-dependent methyltransferase n=1 Tax=Bradyrhizobium sp. 200 TaxID=2782665 RepID=UPI001FFF6448|nr:class I SAM-dependent methyltransferase [Bradyrhizobium sp. 200]UPJ51907.1 methyltransferase domain-containing protein [Bradyrhizobium sp. 200]